MRSRWQLTTRWLLYGRCLLSVIKNAWRFSKISSFFRPPKKWATFNYATSFLKCRQMELIWILSEKTDIFQIRLNKLLLGSTEYVFSPVAAKLKTDNSGGAMKTLSIVQHGNSFYFSVRRYQYFFSHWLISCLMIINDTLPPAIDLFISKA